MFNREKPTETTDTLMAKLRNSPLENIVVQVNGSKYLIPTRAVKQLAWGAIPDAIKDENSEDARKFSTARTGIKALLRPFLPEILKRSCGAEVEIVPRLNILAWLPEYLTHLLVHVIASKEWIIHVEKCETCENGPYKVIGISAYTNDKPDPKQIPATHEVPADTQSIP